MSLYLYLLRHAESVEKQDGQHDRDRDLTQKGVREATLIGSYLYKENTAFDAVICSTALRAKATCVIVADAMKIENERIQESDSLYEASTRTFFEFVMQLDPHIKTVLCVGHNPVISYLAESLTKSEVGDMPPAGLAVIKFTSEGWKDIVPGEGELQNYIYPKMLGSF